MAMRANPVPKYPFNPLADSTAETVQYPSPLIPIRIPIFASVIWLNDIIVSVLNMGIGRPKQGGRRGGQSESVVESAEEGSINESYELAKIRQGWAQFSDRTQIRLHVRHGSLKRLRASRLSTLSRHLLQVHRSRSKLNLRA